MSRNERQTVSYLNRRFREVGLEPNKRHGQNFLVDLNLVRLIEASGDIQPNDVVLEVGTGTGSLTGMLAEKACKVVTVEIDEHLYQLASEELERFDNILMLRQDALKNKNKLSDKVLEPLMELVNEEPGRQFKLIANLPYNVATPIISNLLLLDTPPAMMSVTIQKELGDRMMAKPSTKDYSALSIWMQALCEIQMIRVLPPGVFWPAPKVDSAIMQIRHIPEKRANIHDLPFFHKFTRALFFHRRKFLRSVVISAFKETMNKQDVDSVLDQLDFYSSNTRAEELPVEQILIMSEAFATKQKEVVAAILK